jgi:AcrR family transcriptional regulator
LSSGRGTRKRLPAGERRELIELAATEVFAEHGYDRATMGAIAARSGVTVPVVYDHFESKVALHRRLLERHAEQLLDLWREHLIGDHAPVQERIPRAIEAWATYVESHPYAWQMLFRDTSTDPTAQATFREVQARNRLALVQIMGAEPGAENLAGSPGAEAFELAVEIIRSGLTGLAVWWGEHPQVSREAVIATAMNVLWLGFERVTAGERWGSA